VRFPSEAEEESAEREVLRTGKEDPMNISQTAIRHTKLCLALGITIMLLLPSAVLAYFPSVHYNAMKQAHATVLADCPEVPVLWSVGSHWDQMEADLDGPSHGANVDLSAGLLNSRLPALIEQEFTRIKSGFIDYLNGKNGVSISKPIRKLCHYIADGMAIGQISGPSLWGWKDDIIDLACEGVTSKRKLPSEAIEWGVGNFEIGMGDFEEAVFETYRLYRSAASKWFARFPYFPTRSRVTSMTRRGVSEAGTLTASFILLAWQEAVAEHSQWKTPDPEPEPEPVVKEDPDLKVLPLEKKEIVGPKENRPRIEK
jgi:hypothetical protein